jgi:enamine deaminase RidA (YjgF/YER057c/UK114 family)
MKPLGIVCAFSLVVGGLSAQSSTKQFVPSPVGRNAAVSEAISVGGFVYTSGIRADVKGDITTQTKEIFEKLRGVLRQAGSSLDNVAAVNVMLKNASDVAAFDQVYRTQFQGDLPTRTAYLSRNMAQPGALVEIQMTAIANGGSRKAITPSGWMKPDGLYSYGIQSGDTLFVSAIEPRNYKDFAAPVPNLEVWPNAQADIPSQVKTAIANATEVLRAAGMSFNDAVTSRIAVRDGSESINGPMDATYRALSGPNGATRMRYRGGLLGPYEFQITIMAIKGASPREVLIAPNADGSPGREDPNARFASAIKVGNRFFLSGTTAVTADNIGDIKGQISELLMIRYSPILRAAGFDFKDVVQTEVELTNMSTLSGVDEMFRTLFSGRPPVRHIWGVNALNDKNALIEVGLMAVK